MCQNFSKKNAKEELEYSVSVSQSNITSPKLTNKLLIPQIHALYCHPIISKRRKKIKSDTHTLQRALYSFWSLLIHALSAIPQSYRQRKSAAIVLSIFRQPQKQCLVRWHKQRKKIIIMVKNWWETEMIVFPSTEAVIVLKTLKRKYLFLK